MTAKPAPPEPGGSIVQRKPGAHRIGVSEIAGCTKVAFHHIAEVRQDLSALRAFRGIRK